MKRNGISQLFFREQQKEQQRTIGDRDRSCSPVWLYTHNWVEYSIKKDAIFCFPCYLFKDPRNKGKGTAAFTVKGWRNWNVGDKSLLKHMRSKAHKSAGEKYIGFMNPDAAIDNKIEKWSDEDRRLYKIRLTYTLRCLKFLLHQGLPFRGHDCKSFFDQVSLLLNIVGVSCKRHGMLRNARLEQITKALDCGELKTGSGLNQEMGLPRPGDTRWGSHYKIVCNIIAMYPSIRDVLITLGDDTSHRADWTKIHFMVGAFESFEFVLIAHLMFVVLGYTNELSECLQRREQDILNAISLVKVAKNRMQQLRSNGWNQFLQKVTLFCNKHGVLVPAMEDNYVPYGKSARYARNQTNDDHFRREVYIGVIDQISQELDYRFDEINMELLSCMSALNPSDSFAAFDAQKVRRLADFYPDDIKGSNLLKLELQLDNYIDDLRQDDNFKDLGNLVDLSVKLVQTKRHNVYDMVYYLLKLVLLLPVATAGVERAFSALASVKTKERNKLGDDLLDDCLVTFIERDIFFEVDEKYIIETFMSLRKRRPEKKQLGL